jgi:hypothetical protein
MSMCENPGFRNNRLLCTKNPLHTRLLTRMLPELGNMLNVRGQPSRTDVCGVTRLDAAP